MKLWKQPGIHVYFNLKINLRMCWIYNIIILREVNNCFSFFSFVVYNNQNKKFNVNLISIGRRIKYYFSFHLDFHFYNFNQMPSDHSITSVDI